MAANDLHDGRVDSVPYDLLPVHRMSVDRLPLVGIRGPGLSRMRRSTRSFPTSCSSAPSTHARPRCRRAGGATRSVRRSRRPRSRACPDSRSSRRATARHGANRQAAGDDRGSPDHAAQATRVPLSGDTAVLLLGELAEFRSSGPGRRRRGEGWPRTAAWEAPGDSPAGPAAACPGTLCRAGRCRHRRVGRRRRLGCADGSLEQPSRHAPRRGTHCSCIRALPRSAAGEKRRWPRPRASRPRPVCRTRTRGVTPERSRTSLARTRD